MCSNENFYPRLNPDSPWTIAEIAADLRICTEVARRLCRRGLLERGEGLREIRVTPEAYEDFKANRFKVKQSKPLKKT